MKKALIVSPYLDHLGGGERYMLTLAQVLESLGHEIYFGWDNLEEVSKLASMLGINLKNPRLDPVVKQLFFGSSPLSMYLATRGYDLVIYLSDGSIPLLGGKRNILHMQVPFHNVGGRSWKNQLKKKFIHSVIVNSNFTKKIVDLEYGIDSKLLYPPVTPITTTSAKENIILSVGRFEPSLNAKKQDALIAAFRLLSPRLPDWSLVLAGGSASDAWITHLKELTTGLPIEFMVNAKYGDLMDVYARAKIYWHAAGYGVDEAKNPELTEHFGISTVEAVSAGCVPLIVPRGGQVEIIRSTELHWDNIEELGTKTESVILRDDPSYYLKDIEISEFSDLAFAKNLEQLIK